MVRPEETSRVDGVPVHVPGPREGESLRAKLEQATRSHPAAADVALAVAVLGSHATVAVTAAVLRCSEATLRTAAMPLQLSGILTGATPFRFSHPGFAEVVLVHANDLRLTELRLSAADVLATQVDDLELVVAHILPVGPTGRPEHLLWLREAAAQAMRRGGSTEAVSYLRRALLEPMAGDERALTVKELAYAEAAASQPQASIRMTTLLGTTSEPRDRALIRQRLGVAQMYEGRLPAALKTFDAGADELPACDPLARELRADALGIALMHLASTADITARIRSAEADAVVDDRAGARTRAILGYASLTRSGPASSVAETLAAMNHPGLGPSTVSLSPALILGSTAVLYSGHPAEARSLAKRAMAWGVEHGHHHLFLTGGFRQADVDWWEGHLDDVITFGLDVAAEDETRTLGRMLVWVVVPLWARALLAQGKVPMAASLLTRAGIMTRPVEEFHWPGPLVARGIYRQAIGQPALALEDLLACGRLMEATGHGRSLLTPWRSAAVRAFASLGRLGDAISLAEEELDLATLVGEPRLLGRALRGRALAAAGPDVEMLTASVDVLANSTAALQHARSRIALGQALRHLGQRRDARTHLRIGRDLAQSCNVPSLVELATAELQATGAHRIERPVAGPASLTSTERRVAELAARGQSNAEIARTLTVSLKTVEMHLGHAYRKLGIERRTDLVATLGDPAD